jgi:hypothetical protein
MSVRSSRLAIIAALSIIALATPALAVERVDIDGLVVATSIPEN